MSRADRHIYRSASRLCRDIWERMPPDSPGAFIFAIGLVAVSTIVRISAEASGLPGHIVYFPTFFVAISIASLIGGLGPGLVAAAASFFVGWILIYPSAGQSPTPTDLVNMSLFLGSAGLTAIGGGLFSRAARELAEMQGALEAAQAQTSRALGESVHRTRNLLAVMQALIRHTAREHGLQGAFVNTIAERLSAMGRAQDALLEHASEADLADIVERALTPFANLPGFELRRGPRVPLRPQTVLPFTLALHELATNALKYGGLSARGDGVVVSWRIQPDGLAIFDWTETANVSQPAADGSGSPLIRAAISPESASCVRLDFPPGGVRCEMSFRPRSDAVAAAG